MSSGDVAEIDRKACEQAMVLLNLYHEVIDRKRECLEQMYHDNASLIWNGNPVNGAEAIKNYLQAIPDTEHNVQSIDVQKLSPLASQTLGGECMTANIGGSVIVGGIEHNFTQSLVLILDPNDKKPRILSDRFRYAD
ncbi:unnamed protein product, partial [Mesorhabditis belari]|uniref:NTF2-related export protein n=1 Tax=Mesorhabditis belari TaxID=2138241 RepID=A0AAF3EEG1_9BILA